MDSNRSDYYEQLPPESETKTMTLPTTLPEDPEMLRGTFQTIADAIVKASSFAKRVEELDGEITRLRNAVDEANARANEAYRQRDEARAAEAQAKHDAQMAREAYDTVNAKRIEAEQDRDAFALRSDQLEADLTRAKSDLDFRASELDRVNTLLCFATEERDRYREESIRFRDERETTELRTLELEEANSGLGAEKARLEDDLAIANKALDECASRVAALRSEKAGLETAAEANRHAVEVLTERCAQHERDIERYAQEVANYKERLRGARNLLGSDIG